MELLTGRGGVEFDRPRRFQEWAGAGFFAALWEAGLAGYDELTGIDWAWQAVDGVMTKTPVGGAASWPNAMERTKRGIKRSLLTVGAGIPLAVADDGANRHDMRPLAATLDGGTGARPSPTAAVPPHLCLDAGYNYADVRDEAAARGDEAHIHGRGEERAAKDRVPGWRAWRWVVERTYSWMYRCRRLLLRWENTAENYLAFVHLACAQLIFSKNVVSG